MLTDAEGMIGNAIHRVDQASKGSSGRVIPLKQGIEGGARTDEPPRNIFVARPRDVCTCAQS
jgi:hypothetical protein